MQCRCYSAQAAQYQHSICQGDSLLRGEGRLLKPCELLDIMTSRKPQVKEEALADASNP